jgi:hypothetical protein
VESGLDNLTIRCSKNGRRTLEICLRKYVEEHEYLTTLGNMVQMIILIVAQNSREWWMKRQGCK